MYIAIHSIMFFLALLLHRDGKIFTRRGNMFTFECRRKATAYRKQREHLTTTG
jgi:hypothetical protein